MTEEALRIFKSYLEARPIFHWTEKRIGRYLMLCFIACLIERTIGIELRKRDKEYSPERIRKALGEL